MTTLKRPQLAASEIPDINTLDYPKYVQPKFDGICCVAIDGVAYSRTMKRIPNAYVQSVFAKYKYHGLHGELLLSDTVADYNLVQSAIMSADGEPDFVYMVYDIWDTPAEDDVYYCRLDTIRCCVTSSIEGIICISATELVTDAEQLKKQADIWVSQGFEGAIIRDPYAKYKQGRCTLKSQSLLKYKAFFDDEAEIIGAFELEVNQNEAEKDERGYTKRSTHAENMAGAGTLGALNVKWRDVTFKIGTGFTSAQRQELWNEFESGKLVGQQVTFKYQQLHETGIPRFIVFKSIRKDK